LCKAYRFPTGLRGGGVIGILELGGSWSQHDLDQFSHLNRLPNIQVSDISVDGSHNGTPGANPDADGEVALDIQVAAAAYHYATGTVPTIKIFWGDNRFDSFAAAIHQAVDEGCDVLSISWGADEDAWRGFPDLAFAVEAAAREATAKGMIVLAAAGDNSSDDTGPAAGVDLPSACPHVIGCGGTTKTPFSEVVWGDGTPTGSGTGGGYSQLFGPQAWQLRAPARRADSRTGRMVPDIAANADPITGYQIVVDGAQVQVGGTSAVAPLYAGLFAALGRKLGFITPTLWKNPQAFVDITHGSNGAYQAALGPDPCTGLGVPIGSAIARLFTSSTAAHSPENKMLSSAVQEPINPLCAVFAILKPILEILDAVPFFPPDWKTAIGQFIAVMEMACSVSRSQQIRSMERPSGPSVQAADQQIRLALTAYLQLPSITPRVVTPAGIAAQICPVYEALKPILNAVRALLPPAWSLGIGIAEGVLDQVCDVG
jgi:kumamolisin